MTWVALTRKSQTGWLTQALLFLPPLEPGSPRSRRYQGGFQVRPMAGRLWVPSCCCPSVCSLFSVCTQRPCPGVSSSSNNDTNSIILGPQPVALFNLNYLLKGLHFSNRGIMGSPYELGGGRQNSVHIRWISSEGFRWGLSGGGLLKCENPCKHCH